MTEPTDLPPEQEAVRRLLADARHDGPTPPEVVARLDETLASLVADRRESPSPSPTAPVVDLGARRRRIAGMGLLAAAAVVVAGVAIGQGLPRTTTGSDSGSAAAGDSAGSAERDSSANDGQGESLAEGGQAPQPKSSYLTPGLAGLPEILTFDDDLDDELLDLRDDRSAASTAGEALRTAGCDLPGLGRGRRVTAQIDGAPGVVVFRRTDGASQQVDLYLCGDPQVVRTITLPAP